MDLVNQFITEYGSTILYTIITAIAGYVGLKIKEWYETISKDKTKKSVVDTAVKAVEQIYTDLHGEEKYAACVEAATEMLVEKGITVTDLEIRMLIEAAVKEMNLNLFGTTTENAQKADEIVSQVITGIKEVTAKTSKAKSNKSSK